MKNIQINKNGDIFTIVESKTGSQTEDLISESLNLYNNLLGEPIRFDEGAFKKSLQVVYCQEDNIDLICKSIKIWIKKPTKTKPLNLFFAGSSGVGKTFTAELIANSLETEGYQYCYIPMSEFQSEADVWKFMGSSTGYVGSNEEPKVFQAHSNSNKLVILFDEIEKAHPKIYISLMQLLDKGELSWNNDKRDFKNCILIFTSNIAMKELSNAKQALLNNNHTVESPIFQNSIKEIIKSNGIKTEVSGRINWVLVFNSLNEKAVIQIAIQEIRHLANEYNLKINKIPFETLCQIASDCAHNNEGARPIKRLCEHLFGNIFADSACQIGLLDILIDNKTSDVYLITSKDVFISIEDLSNQVSIFFENQYSCNKSENNLLISKKLGDIQIEFNPNYPLNFNIPQDLKYAVGYIEVQSNEGNGTGTGFIINREGYILTCEHVIENSTKITFLREGETESINAELIYTNKNFDFAILKIESKQELPYFTFIGENEVIDDLTEVALRAYPLGKSLSLKSSIYDGKVNGFKVINNNCHVIQINVDATHGSSGGPVFRLSDGKIIGILSRGITNEHTHAMSINFAIDIRQLYKLSDVKLNFVELEKKNSVYKNEISDTIIEHPIILKTIENPKPKPPKELEEAINQLVFDYCIIDTNIWMSENPDFRKHNLNSIRVLMNLYKLFGNKLIAHGKTYEELKRIKENKAGKYTNEVSLAAVDGFKLLSDENENSMIDIPELAGEHDKRAYADLAIYEYASKKYKDKNSVVLISNDKDCRIRVRSVLMGYKSDIDFKFIKANELKRFTDAIYYTEWYKRLFPRK